MELQIRSSTASPPERRKVRNLRLKGAAVMGAVAAANFEAEGLDGLLAWGCPVVALEIVWGSGSSHTEQALVFGPGGLNTDR